MKILADENFPFPVVESLKTNHDVVWARIDCPGLKDRDMLERAESEGRVIMTLDKDFWQIALQRRVPLQNSGVILFRAFPAKSETLAPLVETVLRTEQPWIGYISVVTKDGIEKIATQRT